MSAAAEEPAKNPRGIPTAPFIADVSTFAPTRPEIEPALQKFQEMIAYPPPPHLRNTNI